MIGWFVVGGILAACGIYVYRIQQKARRRKYRQPQQWWGKR